MIKPDSTIKQENNQQGNNRLSQVVPHESKRIITRNEKLLSLAFIIGIVLVIVALVLIPKNDDSPTSPTSQPANTEVNSPGVEVQAPDTFEGAYISLSTDKESLSIGDSISIIISANNFKDLTGYQFNLAYDPSVLEYVDMTYKNFLTPKVQTTNGESQDGTQFCVPPQDNGKEVSKIACVRISDDKTGVDGSGELLSMNFSVVGSGKAGFQISNIKFIDSKSVPLELQVSIPNIEVS